jgi:hypothetical protein
MTWLIVAALNAAAKTFNKSAARVASRRGWNLHKKSAAAEWMGRLIDAVYSLVHLRFLVQFGIFIVIYFYLYLFPAHTELQVQGGPGDHFLGF